MGLQITNLNECTYLFFYVLLKGITYHKFKRIYVLRMWNIEYRFISNLYIRLNS